LDFHCGPTGGLAARVGMQGSIKPTGRRDGAEVRHKDAPLAINRAIELYDVPPNERGRLIA